MVQKKLQKMIENWIRFWIAQKWKIVSPARLQRSGRGCRGGVGEGSVNYVYRIIVTVFTGSYFQRPKARDLHAVGTRPRRILKGNLAGGTSVARVGEPSRATATAAPLEIR